MPKSLKVPALVGAKVVNVHEMTQQEANQAGIDMPSRMNEGSVMVVEFDNGLKLVPLADPEGNGPGCLTGLYKGQSIYLAKEP